jgi:hypothetical protein
MGVFKGINGLYWISRLFIGKFDLREILNECCKCGREKDS